MLQPKKEKSTTQVTQPCYRLDKLRLRLDLGEKIMVAHLNSYLKVAIVFSIRISGIQGEFTVISAAGFLSQSLFK